MDNATIQKHFRLMLVFLVCYFACFSARAGDAERNGTGKPPEVFRIPFSLERDKMILPVSIRNSDSLKIILDTGMGFDGILLFKSTYVETFGLSRSVAYSIGGAGNDGMSKAVTAEDVTFSAGEAVFRDQLLIILTSETMEDFPTDGVTGFSLLGHYTVEIDQDQKEIRLHDPDTFERDGKWTSIPLTFRENQIPWVEVVVEIEGNDPVTLSCYIDSASRETIEFLTRDTNRFTIPSGPNNPVPTVSSGTDC